MSQRLHTASLFSAFSLTTDNLPTINTSEVLNMALPISQTTGELAKLGADFASININNSNVTCSK